MIDTPIAKKKISKGAVKDTFAHMRCDIDSLFKFPLHRIYAIANFLWEISSSKNLRAKNLILLLGNQSEAYIYVHLNKISVRRCARTIYTIMS